MQRAFVWNCLVFVWMVAPMSAQVFDASQAGVPARIPASAEWRYHDEAPGESGVAKGWAVAGFDDSGWAKGAGGTPGVPVIRWYRIKVRMPQQRPAAIFVDNLAEAFAVYADGRLVGGLGAMEPRVVRMFKRPVTLTLLPQPETTQLAFQVYASQTASLSDADIRIGDPALLQDVKVAHGFGAGFSSQAIIQFAKATVAAVIAAILLFLWSRLPGFMANLWLGIALTMHAIIYGVYALNCAGLLLMWTDLQIVVPFLRFVLIAEIEFVYAYFGRPVGRWARVVQFACAIDGLALMLGIMEWGAQAKVASALEPFATGTIWLVLMIRFGRRGNREAWILTIPALLRFVFWIVSLAVPVEMIAVKLGPLESDLDDIATMLYFLSIGFIVVRRFFQIAQEGERTAGELSAAREVQSRLVPAAPADPPGFRLQAAYLAASEVGGDFYQVFPLSEGRCLVVIGDVSGKGLKAAMSGMLLMGALRTLEMDRASPSAVLGAMNRALCSAKGDSGSMEFATCLCVLIEPSGACRVANAGHLSPCSGGVELAVPSDLPLGVSADVEFEEGSLQLAPREMLTMFSDGVVEAAQPAGELFGFERTRGISGKPAAEIAEAARAWGQNDDITVLTLQMVGMNSSAA